jgi:hypothetical protein
LSAKAKLNVAHLTAPPSPPQDQTAAAPTGMHNRHAGALLTKLPEMPEAALVTLRQNARRVGMIGTARQREDAGTLLQAVEEELSGRLASRTAVSREKERQARDRAAARRKQRRSGADGETGPEGSG